MAQEPTEDATKGVSRLALCIAALLLGTYIGAYLTGGNVEKTEESTGILGDGSCISYPAQTARTFDQNWMAQLFAPAAYVEAKVLRREVLIRHHIYHVFSAEP